MARSTRSSPMLDTVLVTGGTGFLGFYLVRDLLLDSDCGQVYVLDRHIESNLHDGATYIQGSVTNATKVRSLIEEIQPRVIIHAASPNAAFPEKGEFDQYETNVKGTQILLTAASESSSCKALVFTSTLDIFADPPLNNVDESHPLWTSSSSKVWAYGRTKAMADEIVRGANGPNLSTISLIITHLYGARDTQLVPSLLDTCAGSRKLFQLGDGSNMVEVVSVEDSATAHLIAAKALLDPSRASGKVDGEAFIISDGNPIPFWYHVRYAWAIARGQDELVDVTVFPAWIALAVANIAEWLYWLFTLNTKQPPVSLGRTGMYYSIYSHTCNGQKARERLHFKPVANFDAGMKESVEWELNRRRSLKSKKEG